MGTRSGSGEDAPRVDRRARLRAALIAAAADLPRAQVPARPRVAPGETVFGAPRAIGGAEPSEPERQLPRKAG